METEHGDEASRPAATMPPDDQRARWGHQLAECAREIERAHHELATALAALRHYVSRARDMIIGARRTMASPPSTAGTVGEPPSGVAVFRLEGEYWTVAYGGGVRHLKDSRGMRYIACLLHQPGKTIHVLDVVAAVHHGGQLTSPGCRSGATDVGPLADARALAEVRRRLREVQELLAQAEEQNDSGRVALLRAEAERLIDYLKSCSGFGPHARHLPNAAERARQAVTKGIWNAIRRIAVSQPSLATHLRRHTSTGYQCSYAPDPHDCPAWLL